MLFTIWLASLIWTTTPTQPDHIVHVDEMVVVDEPVKPELTIEERIRLQAKVYKVDPELAVRIASCEGGLRQFNDDGSVLRGKQNNKDVGIFQINEKYHLAESIKRGIDIYSIDGNIDYALDLLKREGSKPWNWSKDCWNK